MKSKILMFVLTVGITFFVCSCGNSSNISDESTISTKKEGHEESISEPAESKTEIENRINSSNKDTVSESAESETEIENKINFSDKDTVSESAELSLKYETVNFTEPITLDFVEITIDGADYGDEVKPDNPERVYRYLSDNEGEKFIYIYGTIKNISGDQFEFARNMYASMTFDDKYNYSASVSADENGSFSYLYAYLDPLKSEKFYICASVPDELIEMYNKMVVNFGFKENFQYEYGIQEKDCDYLYSITISK